MSSNTGIANEVEIVESIDGFTLEAVNSNIKNFLYHIFNSSTLPSTIIHAERTKDPRFKADLSIRNDIAARYISVKQGSGNSIHQETLDTFIDYIKKDLGADDTVVDAIKLFHWGYGTLDGTASVAPRLSYSARCL